MRTGMKIMLLGLATVVTCPLCSCDVSSFIPPVELNLAGAGAGDFDVQAGTPQRKTATFRFDSGGYTIGSGSLQIAEDAITVTPASDEGSKTAVTLHDDTVSLSDLLQVESCLEACDLAGVDATTCSNVCQEGLIIVFLLIAATDDADCENGNEYEVRVTLDENVQIADVSVSPGAFIGNTKDLLNSGEFRVCVEVLAGFDASIGISTLNLRVGP